MRSKALFRSGCSVAGSAFVISLFGLGISFEASEPAVANISMDAPIDTVSDENAGDGDHIEAPKVPMPVVGNDLLVDVMGANVCANRDAVVGQLLRDEDEVGGRRLTVSTSAFRTNGARSWASKKSQSPASSHTFSSIVFQTNGRPM